MNNTTNNWEKKLDTFIDNLPSHVGETPRELLKGFIGRLLHDTEIAAREEVDKFVEKYPKQLMKVIREQARKEAREEIKKEIEKWVSENTEISDMIHKSAILTSLLAALSKE